MYTRTLDFETVLKDRLRLPDQPIAQQGIHTRDPPYWSSYMVDYEALIGLSLLRIPQQSVWPGVPCAQTMPPTPYRLHYLGSSV
jgi:hypothetical protein